MPADAWILLIVSVGLGLGLEVRFMLARRRDARSGVPGPASVDGPGGDQ